jgi:hypothetical protein
MRWNMGLEGVSGHPTNCAAAAAEHLTLLPFKKKTVLSHHFCAPLLGHISPLVRTPFSGPQLALTHLKLLFLSCPVLHHSLPHSLILYPQDQSGMFLWKSSTYLRNYTAWHPTPTTSRISNPKTQHNWLWLTNTVVPRALAASSQCPRRKSLLEPSNTSMSVNRFWNSWEFCL